MTRRQVAQMIAGMGMPYAYYQFTEGTAEAPPFVCYFYNGIDDLYADGVNYQKIERLHIELYTAEKDFEKEGIVESTLTANGFPYTKEINYINSEKLWQIAYETEVIINEQG